MTQEDFEVLAENSFALDMREAERYAVQNPLAFTSMITALFVSMARRRVADACAPWFDAAQ